MQRLMKRLASGDAKWGLLTEVTTLGVAFLTFIVVGARLGPGPFGSLAAVLSTIALVSPLITASPEHVIVQRVARGESVNVAWAKATGVLTTVAMPAAVVVVLISIVVSPEMTAAAVLMITVAEITFLNIARAAIRTHEARGASNVGAYVAISMLVTRAISLGLFLTLGDQTLGLWAAVHLFGSALAALYSSASIWKLAPGERRLERATWEDFRLGLPFSLHAGPSGLLSNNDKMVLSGAGLSVDAGIYAAAYRVVSIGGLPSRAVLRTRYASNFRPENQTPDASLRNALSIVKATLPAGLSSCIGLIALSPVVSIVLGDDFSSSVDALRYLAFLPLVRAVLTPGADALTGTGRHRTRIFGTLAAGLMNLVLNLIFIPTYGWQAAVVTTLVAELLLLAWIWTSLAAPVLRAGRSG